MQLSIETHCSKPGLLKLYVFKTLSKHRLSAKRSGARPESLNFSRLPREAYAAAPVVTPQMKGGQSLPRPDSCSVRMWPSKARPLRVFSLELLTCPNAQLEI